jgi:hypothetical protein
MKRPRKWSFLVLTLATIGALVGIAVPASAATGVGGYQILVAHNYQQAHSCVVVGSADGYQGVECADILTEPASGGYESYGRIEVYCQTDSAVEVRCAQVDAEGQLWTDTHDENPVPALNCGHQYGQCSPGRNESSTATFFMTASASTCSSNPSSFNMQWMNVNYPTSIELPVSDTWVSYSGNWSTGHYYICP